VPVSSRTAPDSDGRPYRTDCSGLVSMAWHLSSSLDTDDFGTWPGKTVVSMSDLRPGDGLLKDGHIELFAYWQDPSDLTKGAYVYSLNGRVDNDWAKGPTLNQHDQQGFNEYSEMVTYTPIRYNNIVEDGYDPRSPVTSIPSNRTFGSAVIQHYFD